MTSFTQATLEEQAEHRLSTNRYDFTKARKEGIIAEPAFVQFIECNPAVQIPKQGVHPGHVDIVFDERTTHQGRAKIIETLRSAGEVTGTSTGGFITVTPEDGVLTKEVLRKTLTALYESDAIVQMDLAEAYKAFDIPVAHLGTKGDRPRSLEGYNPNRLKELAKDGQVIAGLQRHR